MAEIFEKTPVTKLMVVAHPDDESLFGGAQLIQEGGWKVVCVTNGLNPIRKGEFHMIMYVTHSHFEMWDYYDGNPSDYPKVAPLPLHLIREDLRRVINEQQWEKIVTHNEEGEYGHPHHIQIHGLMKELVGDELWTFHMGGRDLPDDIWKEKVNLVSLYESQKDICDGHLRNVRGETIVQGRVNLKLL